MMKKTVSNKTCKNRQDFYLKIMVKEPYSASNPFYKPTLFTFYICILLKKVIKSETRLFMMGQIHEP